MISGLSGLNEDHVCHCEPSTRTWVIDPTKIPAIIADERLNNGAERFVYGRLERSTGSPKGVDDLGRSRER